ncbi:MAG: helix-turn-helix domain-containing protein [Actinomycetota bacterium]|nr:helix-turn-helix domain-containing protein [Actinomycetota bacterium]
MDSRKPLGTVTEVSAYLGIPVQTLYQWRTSSKGPRGIKVGKHVRYRWTDVEAWLDSQADQPVGGAA